jgi:hypothetical protein
LYELLHETSRASRPPSRRRFGGPSREGILKTDLSFLATEGTEGAESTE